MAQKPAPRRIYDLDSEVATLKRKYPALDLKLKAVPYTDAERELDRAEWREEHGTDDGYPELPEFKQEAQTIQVKSLAFMDDEVAQLSTTNAPEALRQHLGEEDYTKFVNAGGKAQVLFLIMQQDQQAHQGE